MTIIFASALAVVGLALIRGVWRRNLAYRTTFLWMGWALLLLSTYVWVQSSGVEFGLVFALGGVSLVAWIVTATNTETKPERTGVSDRVSPRFAPVPVIGRQLGIVLLVMVVAGIAGLLSTMGLSRLLPITEIGRMAFVIIALPIVWGVLAFVVCASSRIARPLVMLILIGAGGFGLMMV